MALYIHISVNKETIRTYGAERRSKKAEGECRYRVFRYVPDAEKEGVAYKRDFPGYLIHDRADGAVVLAKKILEFAIEREPMVEFGIISQCCPRHGE